MTDYSTASGEREAFFADLARVFKEHQPISEGYGLAERAQLDRLAAGSGDSILPDGGSISDCIAVIPDFTSDPPSWDCLMYLGPE